MEYRLLFFYSMNHALSELLSLAIVLLKDYSGMMNKKTSADKQRSYNDAMNSKPSSGRGKQRRNAVLIFLACQTLVKKRHVVLLLSRPIHIHD